MNLFGFIRGYCFPGIMILEQMYLDGFLRISKLECNPENISKVLASLEKISNAYEVSFIISLSKDEKDLPEDVKHMIVTSL